MRIATVDFETYYDSKSKYSLSSMTTEEYINDQRFEIIGVAVKIETEPAQWYSFASVEDYANALRHLNDMAVVAHNAKFDGAILSWRLGVKPKFLLDTLSMSRGRWGMTVRHDLDTLRQRCNVPIAKGTEVTKADGKKRSDFTQDELAAYAKYCKTDVEITYQVFNHLLVGYPRDELRKIDLTLRMYTQPVLILDREKIEREIALEQRRKDELLAKLGGRAGVDDLMSNDRFAEILRSLGVDPPTKISVKRGVRTWAFSKSDANFKALLKHDDPLVVAAVEARLGYKSTQRATRAQRLLGICQRMGRLPVPLGYYRAHTGRYGGEDAINLQNLPAARGSKDPDVALLRKAIKAPEGHKLIVCDASQIEARLAFWGAWQEDKVLAFAEGRDVYSEQASVIYGRKVDRKKVAEDYIPGFVGKCVTLGCQYGLGHLKFGGMIYTGMLGGPKVVFDETFAETLRVNVKEYIDWLKNSPKEFVEKVAEERPLELSKPAWIIHLACAKHIIDVYRRDNDRVPELWKTCQRAIEAMANGERFEFFGPRGDVLRTERGAIVLPNGMRLLYPDIQVDSEGQYSCLRYKEGRVQRVKLYGGGILENICQALGNILVGYAMLKIDADGYRVVNQVHDEVVIVAKEAEAGVALEKLTKYMTEMPTWGEGLPLAAEGSIADNYGEAK